jgi:uncharacterized membrane protein YqjE
MKKEENCCDNSFGVASVVLGIIGAVSGILVLPGLIALMGLIFGIIQYKRAKNKWAIWGIVLSAIGLLIAIGVLWQITTALSQFQQTIAACQADPSIPGCEQILQLMGGTA